MYDYIKQSGTLSTGNSRIQIAGSNPRRVCLIISSPTGDYIYLSDVGGVSPNGAYFVSRPSISLIIPFRDFGPLVQAEVWLSSLTLTTQDVIVTEILKLPDC